MPVSVKYKTCICLSKHKLHIFINEDPYKALSTLRTLENLD